MTSKQKTYLKGLTMNIDPVFQIGKSSLTSGLTQAVDKVLEVRELIKVVVLKNRLDGDDFIADVLAERIRSQMVQVTDKETVLYRSAKGEKKHEIVLSEK